MPRPQLLVVDDDEVDVLNVRRGIRKQGLDIDVHVAKDGVEALGWLRDSTGRIPMLLLDVRMPRMTGLELLEKVRQDERLKSSVAFVFSTSDDTGDQARAYALNAAGYIVKGHAGRNFERLVSLLGLYCQVVTLPHE